MEKRMAEQTLVFEIKRQENPDSPPYWETFEIPYKPNSNVISCLMDIQVKGYCN